jgi:hypothetical protein
VKYFKIGQKRNSRQDNSSKRGRESSLLKHSQNNNIVIRPGSSHLGRTGIPDTFTPPCRTHSSKKNKRANFKINSSQGFYTHKLPSKTEDLNNNFPFSGKGLLSPIVGLTSFHMETCIM